MSTGPKNLDTRLLRFRAQRGKDGAAALAADLLEAARSADALEVVGAALKASPADGELLVMEGRARFASGDLLGAQAALLKAAKVIPQRKEPFRHLGEVLLKRGDPQRAAKVLERALAIDANDGAIARLHERARRLASVADSAVDAPAPPEERTVLRPELTEHLRTMIEEVDAEEASLDDEPTSVVSGASVAALEGSSKEEPPKRKRARTLAFGAPAGIAPPRGEVKVGGAAEVAMATEGEIEGALGALDAAASPPVNKGTSFGAMPTRRSAPPPPLPGKPPVKPLPPAPKLPKAKPIPPAKARPAAKARPPAPPFARSPEAERAPKTGAAGPGPKARSTSSRGEPARPAPKGAQSTSAASPRPGGAAPDPLAKPAFPFAPAEPPEDAVAAPREPIVAKSPPSFSAPVDVDLDLDEPSPAGPAPEPAVFESTAPPPLVEPAPRVAADVGIGGDQREDVDAILSMLRAQGLFEPPAEAPAQWAGRAEVKAARKGAGTRVGIWIGLVWVLAIGAAVGGWYGWQWYVGERHRQAAALVAQAEAEAHRGAHADLVAAERHLREARELHPRDAEGPALLLFVHAQRALEGGAFDAGFLRPALAHAERVDADPAYVEAARAVLAAAEGEHEEATTHLAAALEASRDPAILYLAGRLEQRLGGDALAHLEAAAEGAPTLVAPRIALAEVRYEEGQTSEAIALLDAVLEAEPEHLRAKLWRAFMRADQDEPAAAIDALDPLAEGAAENGAATDQVLAALTRARLLRRQGDLEGAGEAVDEAQQAGSLLPRLLALVAAEGRRAGRMLRAEQAARQAIRGAPGNVELRKLLAEIELARRDGPGALATLAELDAADPDVLEMRARAALLVGTDEALQAAGEALDASIEGGEAPVALRALRVRVHARMGDDGALREARALAREVPGDSDVALALGEAALAARDADRAVEALAQATQADPDHAEAHYLLGRAQRMAGDGEAARESLQRALALTPAHTDAQLLLGGLLLDLGDYEAADALYGELAGGQAIRVAGRLGRVEALTGLGRLDDADVQLEALSEDERELPSARLAAARLAVARGQASDALGAIRPLATAEGASATVLALYGDALLMAGEVEAAAEAYDAAVASDGGSPEALLGQADMAVRSDRGDDALSLLEQLARSLERRIRPPAMHARMHLLRGRAHLLDERRGLEAARDALREAVALEGAPAEAHFFLGEALAGADSPEARASYERYLELAPEGEYAARARRAIR